MKFIKLGVISGVMIFLVITALSLLLPSQIVVSRAVDINQPLDTVYAFVNNLNNWPKWMDNFDTTLQKISPNPRGKNAFIQTSEVTVTLTKVSNKKIEAIWQSGSRKQMPGEFNFYPAKGNTITTVQWQFIQKVKWYPWEKFASIATDKIISPYMEKSLDNLKQLAEGPAGK